jgi:hypothetical protein
LTGYEQRPLLAALIAAVIVIGGQSSVTAQTITPDQYHAQAGPCACPHDRMRNGHECGRVCAYCRCGGFEPLCYPGDDKGDRQSNRQRECGHAC